MRERKLRSTAESFLRFKRSRIPYTYYIYKIKREVKNKNTMRICSLSVPRLKDEWNQTVSSVNKLRCGTAEFEYPALRPFVLVWRASVCLFWDTSGLLEWLDANHVARAQPFDGGFAGDLLRHLQEDLDGGTDEERR